MAVDTWLVVHPILHVYVVYIKATFEHTILHFCTQLGTFHTIVMFYYLRKTQTVINILYFTHIMFYFVKSMIYPDQNYFQIRTRRKCVYALFL